MKVGIENNEGNNPSQENKDSTNGDSSKVKEAAVSGNT